MGVMEMASAQQPAAAPGAAALTRAFGAELILLHVLDLSLAGLAGLPTQVAMMPAVDELIDRVRAETAEEMARLQARFPPARTQGRGGGPPPVVLPRARRGEGG